MEIGNSLMEPTRWAATISSRATECVRTLDSNSAAVAFGSFWVTKQEAAGHVASRKVARRDADGKSGVNHASAHCSEIRDDKKLRVTCAD